MVCVGQPLLIAGDLNADPAVTHFLAEGISTGGSCPWGREKARCLMSVLVLVGSSQKVVLVRWQLLQLVGSRIGGSFLISLSLPAFTLGVGLPRTLVPLPLGWFGLHLD